jgi:hypothetical protein
MMTLDAPAQQLGLVAALLRLQALERSPLQVAELQSEVQALKVC